MPGVETDRTVEMVLRTVADHCDDLVALTQSLLRFPSVNRPPNGDERAVQEFLAHSLRASGLSPELFCLDDVMGLEAHPAYHAGGSVEIPRDYRDRPNLSAVWRGQGGGRSLIITGHVDVVPPGDLEQWQHDPWGGEIADNRIYGRGAIDDKGGIAAALVATSCLRELGIPLRGDLILQTFVDEEYGGGNGALAHVIRGPRADAVLMLEPTDLVICPATYGCQSIHIAVHGRGAHPIERWKGVDAIGLAFDVYNAVLRLEEQRCERVRRLPFFRDLPVSLPLTVRRFEARTIGGGSVPDLCELQVWTTVLHDETQESLLAQLQGHFGQELAGSVWLREHPPTIRPIGRFLEGTWLPPEHDLVRAAQSAHRQAFGTEPRLSVGTSGDGFIYANYGHMPLLEMGPGPVHRAHAPDEYVTVNELVAAAQLIALVAMEWCGIA